MRHFYPFMLLVFGLGLHSSKATETAGVAEAEQMVFENESARLVLSPSGEVAALIDRASGTDCVVRGSRIGHVVINGKAHSASRIEPQGDRLRITYGESGATADLRITAGKRHFVIQIMEASAKDAQTVEMINLPLTLQGNPEEPIAACAMALNLRTNVDQVPMPSSRLQARAYAKLGFVGAKAAIILCSQPQLREVMKEVVADADELPHTRIGGPWALDEPTNQGSYILECTGNVGEKEIDRWINMLRELGISQLDFHCGRSFRFGDYTPHPEVYPRGVDSVRAMTDKLHAAGMLAGFHTYAFFIAKDSPFVTPVPHPGLAFDKTYTLSEALPADAATLPVVESTADASAITGFFIRNSATLRIGDELITYKAVGKEAPFRFLECRRGAYGTKPAAHPVGAKVQHLKEMFGLFVPDPSSSLFIDVIERTARMYNDGGFDMIYLDALDGSGILEGDEWAWHHGSRFVFELANRLKKPALFEMSTFHHHLWYVRSRMGAWDCPARAPKPFIDIHRIANQNCRNMFLPAHLGWWAIFDWQGIQPERTTPDVLEYLGCKCLADGCGLSFPVGFTPDAYEKSPNIQRLGKIVRQYEDLRRANAVPEHVRKRLATPDEDFTLSMPTEPGSVNPVNPDPQPAPASPVFRPVRYDKHKIAKLDPAGSTWTVNNRFGKQPVKLRIESLLSALDYDSPESLVIEDFAQPQAFDQKQAATGATLSLEKIEGSGRGVVRLSGTRSDQDPKQAWAMVGRKHDPLLNLANKGLGLWIKGDGRGQTLNLQIKCPPHAYGGMCDRYVKIDFEGWKYVELIEPEGEDIVNHGWPYMPRREEWPKLGGGLMAYAYPALHYHVMYDQIESVNLWFGDLPAGSVSCELGPIKAIPLKPSKMRNPSITLAGQTITFPVELTSGDYLEFNGLDDCKVYGPKGDVVADVKPVLAGSDIVGAIILSPGENSIGFSAEPLPGPGPRAVITVVSQGEPL